MRSDPPRSFDPDAPLRVAAVQMDARLGDVSANLEQVYRLLREACNRGARVIALPEFFTTTIVFDPRVHDAVLPPQNPALDLLVHVARRFDVYVGGSYLERRRADVYNTYVFVQPDGRVFRHDKDQPTMVENAFYVGGTDAGRFETDLGVVGAAVCWELIRTRTVHRLRGRVDLAMTGSHWWSPPLNWGRLGRIFGGMRRMNRHYVRHTPTRFARLVGAPVVHASHAGMVEGRILVEPRMLGTAPFRAHLMGETQIVGGDGRVRARRPREAGPGVVVTNVETGATTPLDAVPNRFWIPRLTPLFRLAWHHQNACGRAYYRRRHDAVREKPPQTKCEKE